MLLVCGLSLQWLRQRRRFHDRWIALIAFALAAGAYLWVHVFGHDWRWETLSAFATVAGYTSSVLGGTFSAALAGNSGRVPGVPATNSK